MHLPSTISNEITGYLSEHLEKHPTDYACVYGSSVYSPDKSTSDVDVFVVTRDDANFEVNKFADFIEDLHLRHGRKLDAEVPYDNKVHYTEREINSAIQFGGFLVIGRRIVVPPVRKEPGFLKSKEIKARLALNGLTTPHAAIGNDFTKYHRSRELAGEAATLLAINLSKADEFSVGDLQEALTASQESGASGEMFLGYKTEYPLVSEYLQGVLSGALERLVKRSIVFRSGEYFWIKRQELNPLSSMLTASRIGVE
jgi:predicted nucleotidyltransferase